MPEILKVKQRSVIEFMTSISHLDLGIMFFEDYITNPIRCRFSPNLREYLNQRYLENEDSMMLHKDGKIYFRQDSKLDQSTLVFEYLGRAIEYNVKFEQEEKSDGD
jgi:hypothetical protein